MMIAQCMQFSLDKLVKVQVSGERTERQAASFSPIRITPVLMEPIDSLYQDKLTSPGGLLMRVVNYLEKTLRVRSIQGNLTIPPTCDEYTYGVNDGKCGVLHTPIKCGIFVVSPQYFGTREVCPSSASTTSCYQSGPNGVGAANTDFLLFVGTKGMMIIIILVVVKSPPLVPYGIYCTSDLVNKSTRVNPECSNWLRHECSITIRHQVW